MMIYVVVQDHDERVSRVYAFTDAEKEQAFETLHLVENMGWEWRERFGTEPPGRVCYFRADSLDTLKYTHSNWFYADTRVYPWSDKTWDEAPVIGNA